MDKTMKRLCTICARGGSKGVKGKNLRILQGKPLIAHSILQALEAKLFDAVAVSSDSEEILMTAQQFGAHVLVRRPEEMATDTAPKVPAIYHCMAEAERALCTTFDVLADLDATSPLRLVDDIVGAVSLLEDTGVSNVITGSPARRSPYFNLVELNQQGFIQLSKPLPVAIARRQDSPRCFDMNASIYVWRRAAFVAEPKIFYADTRLFEMPEERSHDIDSELDFEIVRMLMEQRKE